MHQTRRFIFYVLLGCLLFSPPLRAQEVECYSEARACAIRPSWALSSLVIVAILAIALQRNESFHAHVRPNLTRIPNCNSSSSSSTSSGLSRPR